MYALGSEGRGTRSAYRSVILPENPRTAPHARKGPGLVAPHAWGAASGSADRRSRVARGRNGIRTIDAPEVRAVIDDDMPPEVAEHVRRLRAAIERQVPPKLLDRNLIVASWRWPMVMRATDEWVAVAPARATRDQRAIRLLAEIVSHFDLLAIQGVMANAPTFHPMMALLGPNWAYMMTGLSRESGYHERTAVVFDTRKVLPQGLAGQIVLPGEGKLAEERNQFLSGQFFRPPFFAGFRCLDTGFTLVNQHLVYGTLAERIAEIRALGGWIDEFTSSAYWERNLIVVGQLQLMRTDTAVYRAFIEAGLRLPADLVNVPTYVNRRGMPGSMASAIAWVERDGARELAIPYRRGGVFNYLDPAVLTPPLDPDPDYLSQHLPVWAEFEVLPPRPELGVRIESTAA